METICCSGKSILTERRSSGVESLQINQPFVGHCIALSSRNYPAGVLKPRADAFQDALPSSGTFLRFSGPHLTPGRCEQAAGKRLRLPCPILRDSSEHGPRALLGLGSSLRDDARSAKSPCRPRTPLRRQDLSSAAPANALAALYRLTTSEQFSVSAGARPISEFLTLLIGGSFLYA